MDMFFSELDNAMVSLSNAYLNTDYFGTKRQILAIVATDFSRSTLKAYFPGVTDDLIKEARKHAYNNGKYEGVFIVSKYLRSCFR